MGQLTNLYVSESYQGLLKLTDSTTGLTPTLQSVQDGLGGNSPLQISQTQINISGSLTVNGIPVTTVNTGSFVTTSSFNSYTSSNDSKVSSLEINSGSQQLEINQKLNTSSFNSYTSSNDSKVNSLIASTGSYATTSSLTSLSQSIAITDLAQNNRLTSIEGITGSLATTSSLTSLSSSIAVTDLAQNNRLSSLETNSGSQQLEINQKLNTSSFNSYTSSNDGKVNSLINATGSYATTGSNVFQGSQTISGSLIVTGSITALSASITYLQTVYQTSSIIFSSGSNILGDEAGDTQTLNGLVNIPLGNLNVTGATTSSLGFFGNLQGTASFATNALSASHSVNSNSSISSSFAQTAISSSQAANAVSASQAQNAVSASQSTNTISSSFAQTSISSSQSANAISSSYATNALSASYAPTVLPAGLVSGSSQISYTGITNVPSGIVSGSQQITDLGFATTSSVNQKLDTGSFNSYTASMDARTGSYITTGSAAGIQSITGSLILSGSAGIELDIKGDQTNTGSISVISGSLSTISNNTTVNINLYLTNSLGGQSNIIKGWGDHLSAGGAGAVQANYTGSLRITGSNNIVSMPQIRATNFSLGTDQQGYISGSDNIIASNAAGIYLNTGSLLFPKTQNNFIGNASYIGMNFTTSSLGSPIFTNNIILGGNIAVNSNSGSISSISTNAVLGGTITSTQNFVTNTRPTITGNNVIGTITLNHISSSINYQNNYNNSPVTINNHLSSSNITNNSLTFTNNTILGGSSATGLSVWVSGSQNSNATRTISDNLIGGKNIIISSSFVSSSTSNLVSSLIYGQNLIVSGNHASTVGGSTFLGRYNDATSLHLAQDVVFAVGTGTGTSTRRTGLYVTSGSLVGVSGSLFVSGASTFNGNTHMGGNSDFPLTVSGTIDSKRLHFTSNPFNSNPSSNLGAIRFEGTNQTFYATNYDLAEITTQSMVFQTVVTGSGLVQTGLRSNNGGSDYNLILTNQSGTGSLITTANTIVSGSLSVTNDVRFASGSNKTIGTAVLDGGNPGSVVVSNSLVTSNSIIMLTKQTLTNHASVSITSKGSGTFTIGSSHNGDTDTVGFLIINPS